MDKTKMITIDKMRDGDYIALKNSDVPMFKAKFSRVSIDKESSLFTVYDNTGKSYSEEDIDINRTTILKHLLDTARNMKNEVERDSLNSATNSSSDYIIRVFSDDIFRYVDMFFYTDEECISNTSFAIYAVNENGCGEYFYTDSISVDDIFNILVDIYDEKYDGLEELSEE